MDEYAIELGKLRPLEFALKNALFDTIVEVGNGRMSVAEITGVLEEVKLMMHGVLEYPEGYE